MPTALSSRFISCLLLGLVSIGLACHRAPSPDRPIEAPKANPGKKLEGKDLILRKGLEIKIVSPDGGKRTLRIDNPSGAEGLTFEWRLASKGDATETRPSPGAASLENSGKMTLANTVDGRRMTLPAFWPGGELFMSNSSALWLSDRAFSELKKDGKTQWTLGLLDNPLIGPLQGNDLVEASLEMTGRSLDNKPEQKAQAQELKVTDKSADFALKLNGADAEVEVIEAGNWLARLKILDNTQNPLIVEFEVAPEAKGTAALFMPLRWIQDKLNYRVEEISLQ
ncbi:MAG: hypothetical protein U1F66_02310 [bacterium]